MIREYKTIREISGPLMVVDHVQGVTYDELAEIVLSDGSTRRCKVLEVNGDRAVVQMFEESAGINLADSRIRDRKSTRLNSSHRHTSRMPSSA